MRARLPGAAHANVERNIGPFEFVAPQEPFLATSVYVRYRCGYDAEHLSRLAPSYQLKATWNIAGAS